MNLGSLESEDVQNLRGWMDTHGLLLFREQQLSVAEEVAFAKVFPWDERTPPERLHGLHGRWMLPEWPMVLVQGHGAFAGHAGFEGLPDGTLQHPNTTDEWHSDGMHSLLTPPIHTQMYSLEAPARGGETLFCSAHDAWDALPPEQQALASRLRVRYQRATHPLAPDGLSAEPTADSLDDVALDEGQEVIHPLCRTHPHSGRRGIYAAPMFTHSLEMDGVVLPAAESHRLLGELLRASIGKTPHLRHAWKPRDLVCWDNRRVLHSGTPRARMVGRRLIHRIRMTSAERPSGARREAAL